MKTGIVYDQRLYEDILTPIPKYLCSGEVVPAPVRAFLELMLLPDGQTEYSEEELRQLLKGQINRRLAVRKFIQTRGASEGVY